MNDERNLLSRWSQRKAAVRRGEAPPEPVEEALPAPLDPQAADQVASIEPNQDVSAEGAPADDDMPVLPPIDELTFESDYTVFLNSKVPETLRRAALRKLWTSDPVLANLDGLNDYDEDYNLVDTTITAAQSAYKVGRGYFDEFKDKLEKVEEALGQDAGDESTKLSTGGEGASDTEAVSESDAAGDNSSDAPREVAAAAPDTTPAHPREDSGE